LNLVNKQSPELKTIALLNISFKLIDLLVVHEGSLVYTHELSYDGHSILNYLGSTQTEEILSDLHQDVQNQLALSNNRLSEILKNTIGLHLKHAMQFFYSSKPNTRLDRIILSGDAAAAIPGLLNYVKQEVGKEAVLANPFKDMKVKANIEQKMLEQYAPAFMLCCGLSLTRMADHERS
jgi:type IV pilus assembly protein PilM